MIVYELTVKNSHSSFNKVVDDRNLLRKLSEEVIFVCEEEEDYHSEIKINLWYDGKIIKSVLYNFDNKEWI